MNPRRTTEAVARLMSLWNISSRAYGKIKTKSERSIDTQINELVASLELDEPQAQRFRAHLYKTLFNGETL